MAKKRTPLDLTGLKIPTHVAIIMDGNGRWARKRGLPRQAGHRAGVENLRRVIDACVEFNIKILTIYAFSTENWGRPESEVRGLMRIFHRVLDQELNELHAQGVCLHHLGDLEGVAEDLQKKVLRAIELTKNNQRQILHAVKQMLADGISPDDLTEDMFSSYLFTRGLPDPDLVIRTSGELRVSNFLIWQAAYAEFHAAPEYWPDFGRTELYEALVAYSERDRRFGLLTESE
jgi:undecaprenyl diphosphate synthase